MVIFFSTFARSMLALLLARLQVAGEAQTATA
jgi:hypothetical protein